MLFIIIKYSQESTVKWTFRLDGTHSPGFIYRASLHDAPMLFFFHEKAESCSGDEGRGTWVWLECHISAWQLALSSPGRITNDLSRDPFSSWYLLPSFAKKLVAQLSVRVSFFNSARLGSERPPWVSKATDFQTAVQLACSLLGYNNQLGLLNLGVNLNLWKV